MPIFPTGYTQKTTPADDDQVLIGDSAASNAIKKTKISSIVAKAVTAVSALTNWITTAMIQAAAVTAAKLSTSAIYLGRSTVTATVNWAGTETTIASITVTVPSGGRSVLLKFIIPQLQAGTGTDRSALRIKEGSTILQRFYHGMQNPGQGGTFETVVVAPSAGSHTYIFTGQRDIGSSTHLAYADNTGSQIEAVAILL